MAISCTSRPGSHMRTASNTARVKRSDSCSLTTRCSPTRRRNSWRSNISAGASRCRAHGRRQRARHRAYRGQNGARENRECAHDLRERRPDRGAARCAVLVQRGRDGDAPPRAGRYSPRGVGDTDPIRQAPGTALSARSSSRRNANAAFVHGKTPRPGVTATSRKPLP